MRLFGIWSKESQGGRIDGVEVGQSGGVTIATTHVASGTKYDLLHYIGAIKVNKNEGLWRWKMIQSVEVQLTRCAIPEFGLRAIAPS